LSVCEPPEKPTVTLTPLGVAPSVGPLLSSSPGDSYEWYFGNVLVGYEQTYRAMVPGYYQVRIKINSCWSDKTGVYAPPGVKKTAQAITFQNPGEQVLGDSPFQVQATSTSGLTVLFSTTSDKISIDGSTVTMLKAGETFINATQGGDGLFNAAPTVKNIFCINPPKPVITTTGIAPNLILTASNDTGNQWYLNSETLNGASEKTLAITEEGSYTVITKIGSCVSATSTPYVNQITGLDPDPEIFVSVYPNPAQYQLVLTGIDLNSVDWSIFDVMGKRYSSSRFFHDDRVIDVHSISPGTYILRINNGARMTIVRFVKE